VNSNKVEIDHYELFIDTELEYSGIDVMYIAKRLKPWSWYEVKLRACGFSPGSCSPFSRPALVKTLRDGKCICKGAIRELDNRKVWEEDDPGGGGEGELHPSQSLI